MRGLALKLAVLGPIVTGCASAAQSQLPSTPASPSAVAATPSATVTAVPTPDVMAQPTIDGTFAVGADEHELAIRCYGTGEPTIVFEAGTDSGGIQAFPAALVRPLANTNRTCLYDRLGTGSSDVPTAKRRTVDDVAADLHALLIAADIAPPYLLVGQSGGGNMAVWYAAQHSDDVAGLVLIDVGKDDPDMLAQEFPGEQAWGGEEHIDYVDAARKLANMNVPIGDFPVLVITADQGQGDPDRPSEWPELSPRAREIVMHGGHDLHEEIPVDVAEEIRTVLDEL